MKVYMQVRIDTNHGDAVLTESEAIAVRDFLNDKLPRTKYPSPKTKSSADVQMLIEATK